MLVAQAPNNKIFADAVEHIEGNIFCHTLC